MLVSLLWDSLQWSHSLLTNLLFADSIAYYCLGEPFPISANTCGFLNNSALGCTLINEGSAPQQDGTLKDCPIPAGITAPATKRQLSHLMRGITWEA